MCTGRPQAHARMSTHGFKLKLAKFQDFNLSNRLCSELSMSETWKCSNPQTPCLRQLPNSRNLANFQFRHPCNLPSPPLTGPKAMLQGISVVAPIPKKKALISRRGFTPQDTCAGLLAPCFRTTKTKQQSGRNSDSPSSVSAGPRGASKRFFNFRSSTLQPPNRFLTVQSRKYAAFDVDVLSMGLIVEVRLHAP